jgi:tetratricopeptide (TPR) repeat protein
MFAKDQPIKSNLAVVALVLASMIVIWTWLCLVCLSDGDLDKSWQREVLRLMLSVLIGLVFGAAACWSSSNIPIRLSSLVVCVLAAIPLPSLIHDYWTWKDPHIKEQQALRHLLDKAFDEKHYSDAEKICRQFEEKKRSGYFIYVDWLDKDLSWALLGEKKYDEAINVGRSIVETDKKTPRDLRQLSADTQDLARMYSKAKRYSEAGPLFEAALDLYREDNNLDEYYAVVCRKEYAKMLRKVGNTEQAKVQENEAEKVLKKHNWTYPKCPEEDED